MHRAADAVAAAARQAHQLAERRLHRHAARERMAMAAVGDRQVVAILERADRADRDRLLSLAEVRRPLDLAFHEELLDLVLEEPDLQHLPQPGSAVGTALGGG